MPGIEHQFLDGRRKFQEGGGCFLKIAVINGKLLFTGQPDIITWCRKEYGMSCDVADWKQCGSRCKRSGDWKDACVSFEK